jgi:hypothetical protein
MASSLGQKHMLQDAIKMPESACGGYHRAEYVAMCKTLGITLTASRTPVTLPSYRAGSYDVSTLVRWEDRNDNKGTNQRCRVATVSITTLECTAQSAGAGDAELQWT